MELEVIKHKDILFKDLRRAIDVKSVAWPFPLESQVKWIAENIDDEDEHVFLKDDSKDYAYMNLVKITFMANNTEYMAFGIGNVCTAIKGKGYGGELMRRVNTYLREKRYCGLLFCKDGLVPFYKLYDWKEVDYKACKKPILPDGIHIMTYLVPEQIFNFQYKGKLF
jgi:predicted GNAT family N-acyltransferase